MKHSWSTKLNDGTTVEDSYDFPETIDGMVEEGLCDSAQDVIELYVKNWVIKYQASKRTEHDLQVDTFTYGIRRERKSSAVHMDASTFAWPEDAGLALEQYNSLVRSGVKFRNIETLTFLG